MSTDSDVLLNDFAIRSFRDVADSDYIVARMAYRAHLVPQFLWSGLQAIEKYLKCTLLLNRIPAHGVRHSLSSGLSLLEKSAPFKVRLSQPSRDLIDHLDAYGQYRYLEISYFVKGMELPRLDKAVWELRRYCQKLNLEITFKDGTRKSMLDVNLRHIEASESRPYHKFRLIGGVLETILSKKTDPRREALMWQNFCFGSRERKKIRFTKLLHASNSPLSLHPEILDEVLKYVHMPAPVVKAFRASRSKK